MKLDWQHVTIFAVATAMVLGLVLVAAWTGNTTLWAAIVPVVGAWGATMAALLKGANESVATTMARASTASKGVPPPATAPPEPVAAPPEKP